MNFLKHMITLKSMHFSSKGWDRVARCLYFSNPQQQQQQQQIKQKVFNSYLLNIWERS